MSFKARTFLGGVLLSLVGLGISVTDHSLLSDDVKAAGNSSKEGAPRQLDTSGSQPVLAKSAQTEVPPLPPEDPLNSGDISVWTYSEEFARRFRKPVHDLPGPTGAYAVNFQVQQVEDLDRCVFNVFLDNRLPIDYPEGPVGFLPFTYPMSWAFLNLLQEDQRAVDGTYLAKYRERRAVLKHTGGEEEPLGFYQYRTNLFANVAVVSLTLRCDRIPALKNSMRVQLRTTARGWHEVALPAHFLAWIEATQKKWRRPTAKVDTENLTDRNVWTYTPEFAKRFALPLLNEPPPTGAQAVAFRVERYHKDREMCMLDVYLDENAPLLYPEAETGFVGLHPGLAYFVSAKEKADAVDWFSAYHVYGNTELFAIRELTTDRERKSVPIKQHLEGNKYRIEVRSPLVFQLHRKRTLPGLSYLAFWFGCETPPSGKKGLVGVSIAKTDGTKHEVMLPAQFMERLYQDWHVRHELPFKCRYPKLYPRVKC